MSEVHFWQVALIEWHQRGPIRSLTCAESGGAGAHESALFTQTPCLEILAINAWISSARQTVMRGPNLIGCGNRPDRTPDHHVVLPTGIGPGANIWCKRTNPKAGSMVLFNRYYSVQLRTEKSYRETLSLPGKRERS